MRSHFVLLGAFLLVMSGSSIVLAQEHAEVEPHYRWAVAGFVGATRVHGENESTLGIEGGYVINPKWSVGGVIERADRRRDTTLYLAGIGWHPLAPELRFQFGVGTKDPSGKSELVYRLGFGYEIELDKGWFVKPYVAADFIEHEDNEVVLGLYLGRGL